MRRSILQPPTPSPRPPSRRDNPFATCWTRPGALAFRFPEGEDAAQLVAKLAAQNWRGAIIGPHGCGKSTLLEALKPALAAAGREVGSIALHDGERRLPREFWGALSSDGPRDAWEAPPTPTAFPKFKPASASVGPPTLIVIIDGYEQLGRFERTLLARRCHRTNVGLVVTAHRPTRIPTLIRLAPSRDLVDRLVADLCAEASTPITKKDVAASHDCYGGNVREIFFDLYDRHERGRCRAVGM